MVIDFTVLGVQRDGQTEPYTVQNYSNGKRVKMGSADVIIPPGTHTWTLRFRVDRELGYFSDHDELYWNVTGNGWTLPIERASATVNLPAGAAATITGIAVYTGPVGSTASAATVSRGVDGTPTIVTTTVLNPGEGLTIAVGWPKGYIAQPSVLTRIGWFFRDNSALIAGLLGLIAVFVYYMAVWYRFGKDPERGTIIALFTPPEGMSPGGVRYLSRMAHDSKTFTAALIDMAVKRFIIIHEDGRKVLDSSGHLRRNGPVRRRGPLRRDPAGTQLPRRLPAGQRRGHSGGDARQQAGPGVRLPARLLRQQQRVPAGGHPMLHRRFHAHRLPVGVRDGYAGRSCHHRGAGPSHNRGRLLAQPEVLHRAWPRPHEPRRGIQAVPLRHGEGPHEPAQSA